MRRNRIERIVIIHSDHGNIILPPNVDNDIIDQYISFPSTELRRLSGGSTQFVVTNIKSKNITSFIRHDVVITIDSTYIGYSMYGLFTHKDDTPIFLMEESILNDAREPIRLDSLLLTDNLSIINRYDDTSIVYLNNKKTLRVNESDYDYDINVQEERLSQLYIDNGSNDQNGFEPRERFPQYPGDDTLEEYEFEF